MGDEDMKKYYLLLSTVFGMMFGASVATAACMLWLPASARTASAITEPKGQPTVREQAGALRYSDYPALSELPDGDYEQETHKYLLSSYNGYIAVYNARNIAQIIKVTDTPIFALPQEERERLADGILIEDDDQLTGLLQDYGS